VLKTFELMAATTTF